LSVAKFVVSSTRFLQQSYEAQIVPINGAPAAILRIAGQVMLVITIEVDQGRICAIRVIGNPDKLQRLSSA
jgi:RNA polymerase sigma-70 factor (ECF subfamily)